ncbi:MAG: hypothetical protein Q9206_001659 [Seirophora lacunosa]|nr:MAG: hypothetical protein LQ344_003782 [Seirophora lacunosa]
MHDTELVDICKHLWEDQSLDDEERCDKAQSLIAELSPETGNMQMLRVWGRCRDIVKAEAVIAEKKKHQVAQKAKWTPVEQGPSKSNETVNSPSSKLRGDAPQFEPGRPVTSPTSKQETDDQRRKAYQTRLVTVRAQISQKDVFIRSLQSQITWHTQEIGRLEVLRATVLQDFETRSKAESLSKQEQRSLLSQVQDADERAAGMRHAKGQLMRYKTAAEHERNWLYGEMFPREDELGLFD